MIGQGFLDTTITTRTLEAKLRTLLIAYKSAKDNNRQTGATYCPAPFMDQMDEIFGRDPIISNSHTLNLGAAQQTPLAERRAPDPLAPSSLSNSLSGGDSPNSESLRIEASTSRGLSTTPSSGDSSNAESLCIEASTPRGLSTSNEYSSPSALPINVRKRKSAKENYYQQKLELKKKFYEDIKNMIRDKLNPPST